MVNYYSIIEHYEQCLAKYGDTHKGVDWPKEDEANVRYEVMLDVIKFGNYSADSYSLLDFGCGTAHLLDFINKRGIRNLEYVGLDLSSHFVNVSKSKYPDVQFVCTDVLKEEVGSTFDFVVMNGVFTEKRSLSFVEMWDYSKALISKTYQLAEKGIAFNVMSKAVDWERDDLFHLSTDLLIDFVTSHLTRKFIIRNDYGLYEYTVYIYK